MGSLHEGHQFGSSQGIFTIWQGMNLPTMLRFLSLRPPLHWTKLPRLGLAISMCVGNSVLGMVERLVYSRQLDKFELPRAPVFILGHWRSGTTLLHNLLSLDSQFTCPNLYHILNPHHFLLTEAFVTRLTEWMLPKTRPMDNMEISWKAPQEDETALCNLTLLSPYMMLAFQGDRPIYDRYFDMKRLSPAELDLWKTEFVRFLKKITLNNHKTLLLKSPTHTYRIPLLLELFPDAKFVNIVRNPYSVFSSSMHLRKRLFEANALGKVNLEGLDEDVFVTYDELCKTYEADKHLLGPGQLHEMRFEDLEQDPVAELRKIYGALELEGFPALEAKVSSQLGSLREYRKNEFTMDEALKRRIYERWEPHFKRYQYPSGLASSDAQVA